MHEAHLLILLLTDFRKPHTTYIIKMSFSWQCTESVNVTEFSFRACFSLNKLYGVQICLFWWWIKVTKNYSWLMYNHNKNPFRYFIHTLRNIKRKCSQGLLINQQKRIIITLTPALPYFCGRRNIFDFTLKNGNFFLSFWIKNKAN